MKVIVERFWREPAYCISILVGAGELVLQLVNWPDSIEVPLSVALAGLGGHAIRRVVTPTRKRSGRAVRRPPS